ncbi:MAG: Phage integrase family protein [Lentisphaerae bacterium ADurb.Bin082]|nr:MAG: Phage integrase family protein [Lentisphaerae bacterium ADurb.Bin082]
MRYSYISHNAEAGTPAAVIQRNAGHSNPAMTEHYTRISDEAAVKYAAALALPQPEAAEGEGKGGDDDDAKLARLRELAETATAERIEAAIKALEGEP